MKANITTETKHYLHCPECNGRMGAIDHLLGDIDRAFGHWICGGCHGKVVGTVHPDGTVDAMVKGKADPAGYGLLKLGDLYLVVRETSAYVDRDGADYAYHSHQCPTNLLSQVEHVFDASGEDPHGTMRYVASILDTPETRERLGTTGTLASLFALFDTDGQPAPTAWPEENRGVIPWIAEMQRDAAKKGDA